LALSRGADCRQCDAAPVREGEAFVDQAFRRSAAPAACEAGPVAIGRRCTRCSRAYPPKAWRRKWIGTQSGWNRRRSMRRSQWRVVPPSTGAWYGANQVQRADFLVFSHPCEGSRSAPIMTPSEWRFAPRNHRLGDFLQGVMVGAFSHAVVVGESQRTAPAPF
jgi:hypothetical protein